MKRWAQFILCLVLSFSIWLIHNLTQNYAEVVNVPVLAASNIEGRAQEASAEVLVQARCKTRGSRLLGLRKRRHAVRVFFKPEDLTYLEGNTYEIQPSALYRYAPEIFGDDVSIEAFTSSVRMQFAEESCRKVPVRAVCDFTYKPQYMAMGEIMMSPDSVVVYASPDRLKTIDAVFTKTIVRSDLSKGIKGVVKLEKIGGVRLSDVESAYSLDVVRYVEISSEVPVVARNVPFGSGFSYYPLKVKATFRCLFPMGGNPADNAVFYIDYREFANSISGKCIIHADGLSDSVIDCTLGPEVCDCLERGQ